MVVGDEGLSGSPLAPMRPMGAPEAEEMVLLRDGGLMCLSPEAVCGSGGGGIEPEGPASAPKTCAGERVERRLADEGAREREITEGDGGGMFASGAWP
jgi:hypothetical protein